MPIVVAFHCLRVPLRGHGWLEAADAASVSSAASQKLAQAGIQGMPISIPGPAQSDRHEPEIVIGMARNTHSEKLDNKIAGKLKVYAVALRRTD